MEGLPFTLVGGAAEFLPELVVLSYAHLGQSITVLTYMFDASIMHAYFRCYGIDWQHLSLTSDLRCVFQNIRPPSPATSSHLFHEHSAA